VTRYLQPNQPITLARAITNENQLQQYRRFASNRLLALAMIAISQPTVDCGLVARILVVTIALEESFLSWDYSRRDEADRWKEHYE
jgi:hypothetical protein